MPGIRSNGAGLGDIEPFIMKGLALLLVVTILNSQGCPQVASEKQPRPWDSLSYSDGSSYLSTGWYHESPDSTGVEFEHEGERLFVTPTPIITAGNYVKFTVTKNKLADPPEDYLEIRLDSSGTTQWAEATERAIGKRIAGIVRGRLIWIPVVRSRITIGRTSLPLGVHGQHRNYGMLDAIQLDSRAVEGVK